MEDRPEHIGEMSSLVGKFLIAMPGMGDTRFEKSVIYICAHSDNGAMGFMINRHLSAPPSQEFFEQLGILNDKEAEKFSDTIANIQLHSGGPVEPGRGFVLHTPQFKGKSTLDVSTEICLTATLEILRAIVTGNGPECFNLTLGYSGWTSGQLEEEIATNGWLVGPASASLIFDTKPVDVYEAALKAMGIDPLLLSSDAGHA